MWDLVRICANHSPATCGGRRVLTIQTYGTNAFEIIGRTAWLYQPIWLSSSACRVPSAEILAEFLSAHFQENRTKSAYFWWTNDLFCLLCVGTYLEMPLQTIYRDSIQIFPLDANHGVAVMQPLSNVLPSFPRNCHLRRKSSPRKNKSGMTCDVYNM
jgi:hypothetical protein